MTTTPPRDNREAIRAAVALLPEIKDAKTYRHPDGYDLAWLPVKPIIAALEEMERVDRKAKAICGLCGKPMPAGEEMFKYHGHSGPCPGERLPPMPAQLRTTEEVENDTNEIYLVAEAIQKNNTIAEEIAFDIAIDAIGAINKHRALSGDRVVDRNVVLEEFMRVVRGVQLQAPNHMDHYALSCIEHALSAAPLASAPTTEDLDRLQFGKVLHQRPSSATDEGMVERVGKAIYDVPPYAVARAAINAMRQE